jgi:hypothetical protein
LLKLGFPRPIEPMERAGRLLGKLKLPKGAADPAVLARAAWKLAAGRKIHEHTRATDLVRKTLIVEVEDMIWQRQLNALKHFLVRNLNEALGEAAVLDIDFRPMPPRRKPQRATQLTPAPPTSGIQDPVMTLLYQQSRRARQPQPGTQVKNRNTA